MVEAGRKYVHNSSENLLIHIVLMLVFYGVLTVSVFGIVIVALAWWLSSD